MVTFEGWLCWRGQRNTIDASMPSNLVVDKVNCFPFNPHLNRLRMLHGFVHYLINCAGTLKLHVLRTMSWHSNGNRNCRVCEHAEAAEHTPYMDYMHHSSNIGRPHFSLFVHPEKVSSRSSFSACHCVSLYMLSVPVHVHVLKEILDTVGMALPVESAKEIVVAF